MEKIQLSVRKGGVFVVARKSWTCVDAYANAPERKRGPFFAWNDLKLFYHDFDRRIYITLCFKGFLGLAQRILMSDRHVTIHALGAHQLQGLRHLFRPALSS